LAFAMTVDFWNGAIVGGFVSAAATIMLLRRADGRRYAFNEAVDAGANAWRWYVRLLIAAGIVYGGCVLIADLFIYPQPPASHIEP
jgi:hypothetical protein